MYRNVLQCTPNGPITLVSASLVLYVPGVVTAGNVSSCSIVHVCVSRKHNYFNTLTFWKENKIVTNSPLPPFPPSLPSHCSPSFLFLPLLFLAFLPSLSPSPLPNSFSFFLYIFTGEKSHQTRVHYPFCIWRHVGLCGGAVCGPQEIVQCPSCW